MLGVCVCVACFADGYMVYFSHQVAAQLGAMRDENRRVWEQLSMERKKVDKLVTVVNRLWDIVQKGFPGSGRF